MNNFVKSHGLGNDYIVIDEKKLTIKLNKALIKKICNRNYGIGSDGLLLVVPSKKADFGLRIFNPDGSEAEKSGNGLRIFSKFLYDNKYTKKRVFTIETKGGIVKSEIMRSSKGSNMVKVEMGHASFESKEIPLLSNKKLAINEKIKIKGEEFVFTAVTVGNPHCVIFKDKITPEDVTKYGPLLEKNRRFPKRINIQFAQVISRNRVKIEIWERGAGYTLASGSSSCAVVSAGHKLGLLNKRVRVEMQGGFLFIEIDDSQNLIMEGPVEQICSGEISFV
jgi:diaminopimelate epimerase